MTTYSHTARNQVEEMENSFNELTTFAYDDVGRVVTQQNDRINGDSHLLMWYH